MGTGLVQQYIGKNLIIQITPQDVSAAGVLTDNAVGTFSMQGRVDPFDMEAQLTSDNISPTNAFNSNPVPYEFGATYTVTEIMQALPLVNSSNKGFGFGNVLMRCSRVSFYAKMVLLHVDNAGSPGTIEQETIYGLWTTPRGLSIPKGKGVAKAILQTILVVDTATNAFLANPSYT